MRRCGGDPGCHGGRSISVQGWVGNSFLRDGPVRVKRPQRAAFAMAPLGLLFDAKGLSHVQAPVFLYYAQDDRVLLPKFNALHVAPPLGSLRGIKMVPKAGHYVFLSPCSPRLTQVAAAICKDPAGVDRIAVHRQLNADALAFFNEALQVQTPP